MTAEHYHALYRWFDAHPAARRFVVTLDRWLPLVPFVCYPVLLCRLNVQLVQLHLKRQNRAPEVQPDNPGHGGPAGSERVEQAALGVHEH